MREVDISIVTYQPDFPLLTQLLESLSEPTAEPLARNAFIQDNSPGADVAVKLVAMPALQPGGAFARVDVKYSGANLGFGRAHNANAARGTAPFILVLNQDCVLEPGVLARLVHGAAGDPEEIGAWELRQIPYEHPKTYDPVSLDTPWASGAAVLLRRKAFEAIGGFEPRIFMYGEDGHLSWRARAEGGGVVYPPKAGVVHPTHPEGGGGKTPQGFGGGATHPGKRPR